MLELNQIHLATEEDRARGLDKWAELFKATTWEEIKMLAAHNASFGNIAQELYKANADERIRQECEAREEFYFQQRRQQERWEEKLKKAKTEQRRQRERVAAQQQEIKDMEKTISSLETENARLREQLAKLDAEE